MKRGMGWDEIGWFGLENPLGVLWCVVYCEEVSEGVEQSRLVRKG